jgi:hypothetical protein
MFDACGVSILRKGSAIPRNKDVFVDHHDHA